MLVDDSVPSVSDPFFDLALDSFVFDSSVLFVFGASVFLADEFVVVYEDEFVASVFEVVVDIDWVGFAVDFSFDVVDDVFDWVFGVEAGGFSCGGVAVGSVVDVDVYLV